MRRFLIIVLLAVACAANAQVRFAVQQSGAGEELTLTFKAKVAKGYHVNATLEFEKLIGIMPVGDMVRKGDVFTQRLKVTKPPFEYAGYLEYYACNDDHCLSPASVDFTSDGTALIAEDSNGEPVAVLGNTRPAHAKASVAQAPRDTDTLAGKKPAGQIAGDMFSLIARAASPLWTPVIDEMNHLAQTPTPLKRGLFGVFLICFAGGLLTILTPCVWPIIPLTVSFFIKRGEQREKKAARVAQASACGSAPSARIQAATRGLAEGGKAPARGGGATSPASEQPQGKPLFSTYAADNTSWRTLIVSTVRKYADLSGMHDALAYGASIIVLFMVLGIAMTLIFGAGAMNDISTNAVFNLVCFVLLVVFGLSFMGLIEFRLPATWAGRLDSVSTRTRGFLSMLAMALTLVVVSFSCTAPVIGYLLVEIASEGSLLAPAVGMFAYALALALPFALFALFPAVLKKLPRSGQWMTQVKVTLGFLEIAFALKFLSVADMAYGWGILPRWLFLSLWIVIFTALAVYHFYPTVKEWASSKTWRRSLTAGP